MLHSRLGAGTGPAQATAVSVSAAAAQASESACQGHDDRRDPAAWEVFFAGARRRKRACRQPANHLILHLIDRHAPCLTSEQMASRRPYGTRLFSNYFRTGC